MNGRISGVKNRKERVRCLGIWLCMYFRKRILQVSEWTEVSLKRPGAQKFEVIKWIQIFLQVWWLGFGSACLGKRGLYVSEARQRIMGEWEGDKRTPLEVERGGARGVQEDQRGRKA